MSKIFISHSSANNAAALAVAAWLQENGWGEYFLDVNPQQGLVPGERWQQALKSATDRCEAVLFLISPAWRDSRWCLAEFLLAKQLGKKVFGVLIEPTPLESLPKEMTAEWQLCDLAAGVERCSFTVRADPIVPETTVSLAATGLRLLKIGLQKAGLDAATFQWPPSHDPDRAPYRGLKPLETDDAAVFFGREAAITRGLDELRSVRQRGVEGMVVILGASGAGKSSYLRAGLWPRLIRDDHNFVTLPIMRPQGVAITGSAGLVSSFDDAFRAWKVRRSRADIQQTLSAPDGFVRLVSELRAMAHKPFEAHRPPPTVLMAIDQGEELFVSEGRNESDRLLAMLAGALATPGNRHPSETLKTLAVIAIRSDAYDRLQSEPRLAGVVQRPFNLSPIARGEFKSIITGPAERTTAAGRALRVEPALTERLLHDTEGADALPLLAFVLERLYLDYGGDGQLSVVDYDALGGVRGSIEAAVESAFAHPGRDPVVPAEKVERERLLRRGFLPWLAGIDPDTEERRRRVANWEEIPSCTHAVLERLIEARLLVRDRRPIEGETEPTVVVEVAHEALLRQWPTLTGWLDEDADALKGMEALRRAASEWIKNRRESVWLVHTGERLERAEALRRRPDLDALIGDVGRDYLHACRARDDEARTDREAQLARISAAQTRTAAAQRRSTFLLAAIALGLIVFGGWIVTQGRSVARQRSRVLIVLAEQALSQRSYDRALRFAVLAATGTWLSPVVPEADAQLARAAYMSREIVRMAHDFDVLSAVFSVDGRVIATASNDKTARVWDANTGAELARVNHDGSVADVALSRDGARLFTGSVDKTARISDARTGREIARVWHEGPVLFLGLSADGHLMWTASGRTARILSASTGAEIAILPHTDAVSRAAFSPDGRYLLTGSDDGAVRLWSLDTRREIVHTRHLLSVSSVAFSPDGRSFVSASHDRTAIIAASESNQEVRRITHDAAISSAVFSPDGGRILTTSFDGTARITDVETGHKITQVTHDLAVKSASFSPDGQRLVTFSLDQTARVSDAWTGREIVRVSHGNTIFSATFDQDGRRLLTASADKTVRVSSTDRGEELARFTHDFPVRSAVFSSDGRRLLAASLGNTAFVSDAETGLEVARIIHDGEVHSAIFSPDGKRTLTASADKTVRISEAHTGREIGRMTYSDAISSAIFSSDGDRVVTALEDGTARVSDAETGEEIVRVKHERGVLAVALSRDGRRLVTGSEDKKARIWDSTTGKEVASVIHDDAVLSVAFSPDNRRIVTAYDKTVRVSDAETGKQVLQIRYDDSVRSAMFSPDGQRLVVTGLLLGTVWVSNAHTGHEIARLAHDVLELAVIRGYQGLESVAANPDGRRLVTVSSDTMRVFDALTGKLIASVSPITSESQTNSRRLGLRSAVFNPNGDRIVTASFDKTVRIWDATWLTRYDRQLIRAVCNTKLIGARQLSAADVAAAPVLVGRQGEDVCLEMPTFRRVTAWLQNARR